MSNNPEFLVALQHFAGVYRQHCQREVVLENPLDVLVELETAADVLVKALALPSCPTPWEWFTMGHPDIDKIKADGTRIMVFVSRKVLPKGALGQHYAVHPAKLTFARWVTTLVDTPAARSSRHAQALLDKHGGFWAMDRRGLKPIKGAPELWCYLPDIGE